MAQVVMAHIVNVQMVSSWLRFMLGRSPLQLRFKALRVALHGALLVAMQVASWKPCPP